jgi:hypothetical protein
MRVLIVYESMYGNTKHIAEAIAEGLGDGLGDATAVDIAEVGAAPTTLPDDLELLVVGGPTHAHGMSRASSRHDAATKVAQPVISTAGIREWIETLRPARPLRMAAFDTRIDGPKLLTGSAAEGAAKALKGRGLRVAAPPASFVLDGITGDPHDRIAPAELDRARAWGRELAATLPVAVA